MTIINRQDTDGTKAALSEGELGYDKQGTDRGRVYVGTDAGNVPLAKQDEKVDKITSTSNALARHDGAGGLLDSNVVIDGDNNVSTSDDYSVNVHDIFEDGSIIATYQLDGNANDLGGNYHGIATNVTYADGKFGQAGVFDGASSLIDTGIAQSSLSSGFCVSVWINSNLWENAKGVFGNHTTSGIVGFQYYNGDIAFGFFNSLINCTTTQIPTGQWKHLIGQFDGTNISVYIDGVHIETKSAIFEENSNIFLGRAHTNSDRYFDGQIDQVRIFNRALSADEVQALYNESSVNFHSDVRFNNQATFNKSVTFNESVNFDRPVSFNNGSLWTHDIFGDGSSVALYPMDGDAKDAGGVYDGTATGVTWVDGKFGQAASFDGASTKINIAYDLFKLSEFSISMWINANDVTSNQTLAMNTDGTFGYHRTQLYIENSNVNFIIGNGSTNSYVTGAKTISTSTWLHIVFTYSPTAIKTFIDSVIDINNLAIDTDNPSGLGIGADIAGNYSYYEGLIDKVRIFNRALSADEVQTLYNEKPVKNEAYHQGNILGKVSQLNGVPTGAILENGSNVNGVYLKIADGTLICHNENVAITTDPYTFVGTPTSVDGDKLKVGRWV